MPDNQIFKATYSGVPVYEMMCKGVAVMRRRADGWLNATQILKVAGFDKPQRTRILEREVQKGEHEKVQGGYGKYQGTWIPIERGLDLARQYSIEHALQPIIEFQPASKSPPLAPKHLVTATSNHSKPISRTTTNSSLAGPSTRGSRQQAAQQAAALSQQHTRADSVGQASPRGSEDGSMTPSPSASSSSRTPSPIHSPALYSRGVTRPAPSSEHDSAPPRNRRRVHDRQASPDYEHHAQPSTLSNAGSSATPSGGSSSYAEQMLEYFISDTGQTPAFLIDRPADFDPNVTIDDDGHTALHWAAAMGRIKVVKLLVTAGADMYRVNKSGQTPLMRSVMFANNYDVRKFPELYELLHRSTLNIDHHNRTVFHHVVDVAMSKNKAHAARYYMETILARLSDYPNELRDVVNFQDEDGETALTMAARCRSKRLVKQLIDVGASVKIANNDGKSAEDYILEDERFRASPPIAPRLPRIDGGPAPLPIGPPGYADAYGGGSGGKMPFAYAAQAQKASARVLGEMSGLLDGLASAFDTELRAKERDSAQAQALLGAIQAEILDSQRSVSSLRARGQNLSATQAAAQSRGEALRGKMEAHARVGLERWLAEEETREREIRIFGPGEVVAQYLAAEARASGMGSPFAAHALPAPSGESPVPAAAVPSASATAIVPPAGSGEEAKGKARLIAPDEDTSDLRTLYADIPLDPSQLAVECGALRNELVGHRSRRRDVLDATVRAQGEHCGGERMNGYRRLIGQATGGVPPGEVDAYVGMLLEALEQEEPASAASMAWSTAPTPAPAAVRT